MRRGRGGVRRLSRHQPRRARRLPRQDRCRDHGHRRRPDPGGDARERLAACAPGGRAWPHRRPAGPVRQGAARRGLSAGSYRPRHARPSAAAAPRLAPAHGAAGSRRGVRRVELPARLLDRRWRHRLGAGPRGCPVVVKGHPAHPQTGALVASAIERAVEACGLPKGVVQPPDRPTTNWAPRWFAIPASRRSASPARARVAWRW